jgi:hypothetical protein
VFLKNFFAKRSHSTHVLKFAILLQDDGYIPKHSVLQLQNAWPGTEVRWVIGGHVSSFLLHNGEFRRAIVDGLNRLEWKESQM